MNQHDEIARLRRVNADLLAALRLVEKAEVLAEFPASELTAALDALLAALPTIRAAIARAEETRGRGKEIT